MPIIPYLQTNKWLSRRKIVSLIQNNQIILNNKKIESYKSEINNWDILTITDENWEKETIIITENNNNIQWKLIMFNKPKWYVVSKFDPHNTTIYELLPEEFKNRYYIWRLDKDSRWLVLLTNTPALVNQFEHPKYQIEKDNGKVFFQLGGAYHKRGLLDNAIANYKRAAELMPNYADPYINLGDIYASRKEYASSLASYNAALAIDPSNSYALRKAKAVEAKLLEK